MFELITEFIKIISGVHRNDLKQFFESTDEDIVHRNVYRLVNTIPVFCSLTVSKRNKNRPNLKFLKILKKIVKSRILDRD